MSGESSTTRIVALGVASCVESMEWGLTRPSFCAIKKITKDSRYVHSPAFNVKRIREQIIFRASMTCLPSTAPCRKLVQPVIANFLPCRLRPARNRAIAVQKHSSGMELRAGCGKLCGKRGQNAAHQRQLWILCPSKHL